jgi:hypothetical protein
MAALDHVASAGFDEERAVPGTARLRRTIVHGCWRSFGSPVALVRPITLPRSGRSCKFRPKTQRGWLVLVQLLSSRAMRFPAICTLSALLALALAPLAAAQGVEPLTEAGKWSGYTFLEEGNKGCYMAAPPDKSEGNYRSRGDVYALVTHRPAQNSRDVVSLIAGYTLKPDADIVVTIDRKQKFTLFADKETAWARDDKTDRALVQAMIKGGTMVVEGVSSRGTKTRDTYSLSGFGKVYQAISQACGIRG